MATYLYALSQHLSGREPVYKLEGSLTQAKRAAVSQLGEGSARDFILIYQVNDQGYRRVVAQKQVSAPKWTDIPWV